MKRFIVFLFMAALLFPAIEASAQSMQVSQEQIKSQKKAVRKAQREQRQKVRQEKAEAAFQVAVQALKDKDWAMQASTVFTNNGTAIPVSDNTNFILFKNNTVYLQLAFSNMGGPNGLGGITLQGFPSNVQFNTDKNGNITYSFVVMGSVLNAQVVIYMNNGSNYANASVYSLMSTSSLTFTGAILPSGQANIFQSGFTY